MIGAERRLSISAVASLLPEENHREKRPFILGILTNIFPWYSNMLHVRFQGKKKTNKQTNSDF